MEYLPLAGLVVVLCAVVVLLRRPLSHPADGGSSLRAVRWLLSLGAVVLVIFGVVQFTQTGAKELEVRRVLDNGTRSIATVVDPFGAPTFGEAVTSRGGCRRAHVQLDTAGERRLGRIDVDAAIEGLEFEVAYAESAGAGYQTLVATEARCRAAVDAPETGFAALLLGGLYVTLRRTTLPFRAAGTIP